MAADATSVTLPDDEAHHLLRVLRLKPGAAVAIFDGAGREWNATVETAGRSGASVRLEAPVVPIAEPPVAVTLGVALQKGDRMDTIVSEATALGVIAVAPLSTAHVAVPARGRDSGAAVARWERVAVAAAKQCGRATVPGIRAVASLEAVLEAWRDGPILMCVEPGHINNEVGTRFPENESRPRLLGAGPKPASALVLVGPEGGWTDAEVARVVGGGGRLMHLGPRTLRADLAPAVLLSALWTSWGW